MKRKRGSWKVLIALVVVAIIAASVLVLVPAEWLGLYGPKPWPDTRP